MNKTKILTVDDDAGILAGLKRTLEALGSVEVRTERDPQQALRSACDFRPDIILLDVDMPKMDGGDVAQGLRGIALTKDIPIIFLSSLVKATEAEPRSQTTRADYFAAKPASSAQLRRAIEERLGRPLGEPGATDQVPAHGGN